MNDLLFIGDPHGLLPEVAMEIAPLRPKAVIGLGDFDLGQPLEREVKPLTTAGTEFWWIHGNHDNDNIEYYYRLFNSAPPLCDLNLHARVVEIGGVRIAGLGGIFKGKVWRPDPDVPEDRQVRWRTRRDWLNGNRRSSRFKDGLGLDLRDAIFPEDFELLRPQRADVLVTHEAPSCHRHGFAAIDELAAAMRVSLIIHGHHHVDYLSSVADGRIQVIGVGLAGVIELSENFETTVVSSGRKSLRVNERDS